MPRALAWPSTRSNRGLVLLLHDADIGLAIAGFLVFGRIVVDLMGVLRVAVRAVQLGFEIGARLLEIEVLDAEGAGLSVLCYPPIDTHAADPAA